MITTILAAAFLAAAPAAQAQPANPHAGHGQQQPAPKGSEPGMACCKQMKAGEAMECCKGMADGQKSKCCAERPADQGDQSKK